MAGGSNPEREGPRPRSGSFDLLEPEPLHNIRAQSPPAERKSAQAENRNRKSNQTMEKRDARHKAKQEGEITPQEPGKLKAKATLQDTPSVGIAALSHLRLPPRGVQYPLADTLPSSQEDGPVMISSAQLRDMIDDIPAGQFLLLDLRVFPQFSQSRIHDALNLCIPTTLLKRPSFNLQKLQDTFTNEAEKARFSQWRNAKFIVLYDAFSEETREATSAINTLKKFSNEGWKGRSYILRGGFADFSKRFPRLIDRALPGTQVLPPGSLRDLTSATVVIKGPVSEIKESGAALAPKHPNESYTSFTADWNPTRNYFNGSESDTSGTISDEEKSQSFFCNDYPPYNLSFSRSEHLAGHIRYDALS